MKDIPEVSNKMFGQNKLFSTATTKGFLQDRGEFHSQNSKLPAYATLNSLKKINGTKNR